MAVGQYRDARRVLGISIRVPDVAVDQADRAVAGVLRGLAAGVPLARPVLERHAVVRLATDVRGQRAPGGRPADRQHRLSPRQLRGARHHGVDRPLRRAARRVRPQPAGQPDPGQGSDAGPVARPREPLGVTMSGPKRNPDRLNTIGVVVVGICGAVLVYVTIVALEAFYVNDTSEIQTMADYGGQDTGAKSLRTDQ